MAPPGVQGTGSDDPESSEEVQRRMGPQSRRNPLSSRQTAGEPARNPPIAPLG